MVGRIVADGIVWMDRAEVGFPKTVLSTDGLTPRPKMDTPCRWITLHYTGSPRARQTSTRDNVVADMQTIEANAVAQGKSNEYNYVIFAIDDGAVVVEYAGAFRAAHSEGENSQAVGVLFNLGCTKVDAKGQGLEFQTMPDSMVHAYRYLRDEVLRPFSITNLNTLEVFHQDMPDAATQCPGHSVIGRGGELLTAMTDITPPVNPPDRDHNPTIDPAVFSTLPTIQPGDQGDNVRRVQALLISAGFDPGELDGKYLHKSTSPTHIAIVGFQQQRNLPSSGVIALSDWAHLLGLA